MTSHMFACMLQLVETHWSRMAYAYIWLTHSRAMVVFRAIGEEHYWIDWLCWYGACRQSIFSATTHVFSFSIVAFHSFRLHVAAVICVNSFTSTIHLSQKTSLASFVPSPPSPSSLTSSHPADQQQTLHWSFTSCTQQTYAQLYGITFISEKGFVEIIHHCYQHGLFWYKDTHFRNKEFRQQRRNWTRSQL